MKTILCLLALLFSCTILRAQVLISLVFGKELNTDRLEFGLTAGPGLAGLTNMQGKSRPALDLGLYFDYKLTDRWYLHPEASPKSAFGIKNLPVYATGNAGIDSLYRTGAVQKNIKGMCLPLLVRYRITGMLFAELGPQVDWYLKSKDIFKVKINDNPATYITKTNSSVTTFGIDANIGLAYKLRKNKGLGIGLRYTYGLTDIIKNAPGSQRNKTWFLIVTIPIGTGGAKHAS